MRQWINLFEHEARIYPLVMMAHDQHAYEYRNDGQGAANDLATLLNRSRIPAQVVHGMIDYPTDDRSPHYWVETGDLILDPTINHLHGDEMIVPKDSYQAGKYHADQASGPDVGELFR